MKIVVLAGGISTERDVSLITGTQVKNALKKNGHKAFLLDVFLGYGKEGEDLSNAFEETEKFDATVLGINEAEPDIAAIKAIRKDDLRSFFGPNVLKLCGMADIVFMALHGENGENGKIQATFDLLGIKYTGTGYLSSALAMDKGISKKLFLSEGVPTPKGRSFKKTEVVPTLAELGYRLPCIVKPSCGGSSIGVYIANNQQEFEDSLEKAFSYEEEAVVEEFIKGREFSVGVIQGKALPIIEIAPLEGFYDYKNKYQAGSAIETCPADLSDAITEKMQRAAEKVSEVLGLTTYSRSDFLLDDEDNIYCLEANTLPGMTPTSLLPQEAAALGMNFETLCETLINVSLEKYN